MAQLYLPVATAIVAVAKQILELDIQKTLQLLRQHGATANLNPVFLTR
jgi:hypothetical protein